MAVKQGAGTENQKRSLDIKQSYATCLVSLLSGLPVD